MLRVHGPKIINTLKFRLHAPNSVFIGEKVLLHVTEGKWKKQRKSNATSKVMSRNGIQTNAVSLWPLQTIWKGDVSSALYSCVWGLGSAAAGGWGEGLVRAWRCCFQNKEAHSKGGIRWQGPCTLIRWRRRWTGVGALHRWPLWVERRVQAGGPVWKMFFLWILDCDETEVGREVCEWHLSGRVLGCSKVILECWLPGFITSM